MTRATAAEISALTSTLTLLTDVAHEALIAGNFHTSDRLYREAASVAATIHRHLQQNFHQ